MTPSPPSANLGTDPATEQGAPATNSAASGTVEVGPCYGVLAGLHGLARELGIVSAVGEATRTQRLASYLVYARLWLAGSRLAARASEEHAVREVLEVRRFDEEDLYEALEHLRIHPRLCRRSPLPALDPDRTFSSNEAAPRADEAGTQRANTQRYMPRRSESQPR